MSSNLAAGTRALARTGPDRTGPVRSGTILLEALVHIPDDRPIAPRFNVLSYQRPFVHSQHPGVTEIDQMDDPEIGQLIPVVFRQVDKPIGDCPGVVRHYLRPPLAALVTALVDDLPGVRSVGT